MKVSGSPKIARFLKTIGASLLGTFVVVACTVRTPTTETPIPTDRGIDKSFFVETKATVNKQGQPVTEIKPKTFLCGWAPISETGAYSSAALSHAVHMASHCNIQFEITEDALIGRMVNPTFPNESSRWKIAITIPIRKHYYYERAKDNYGRETNEFIENDKRSHFSARPMMDLGLERISINDWDLAIFHSWGWGAGQIQSIEDVEWDKENGFLAFTANLQSPTQGADVGARMRFNFKSFTHNDKFETTPYSPLNAKHLNALHVMGEKVEGVAQIWSAAKWDLSKTHDIYTYGFPAEYLPIAEKVIDQWNDAFKAIGKPAAFRLNKAKMKYPYDLRYPMIVWVDDSQISAYSPLGIGMAQADVLNGELIWGQVTLYGGKLERYVKMFLGPVGSSGGAASKTTASPSNIPAFFQTYFNPQKQMQPAPGLEAGSLARLEARVKELSPKLSAKDIIEKSGALALRPGEKPTTAQLEAANAEAESIFAKRTEAISQNLRKNFDISSNDFMASQQRAEGIRLDTRQLYGFANGASQETRERAYGKDELTMSRNEKISKFASRSADELKRISAGVTFDADRRFVDVGPSMIAGLAKTGVTYDAGLRNVIHELIVHEVGHMLGLGHQFKENIVPADGTVPAKYIAELKKGVARGWTNSSSVMGYKHPVTELTEDPEKIGPGPQDLLTLRYLYNREYATFRRGSTDADFSFAKVPASGVIPSSDPDHPEQVTSYFPQCNDFDATFGTDPYCNRFDRGNDAASIVKNYFDDLNANMVSRIYAFTDSRGANTDEAEANLWWRSLTTFGRIRTFYDHMRQKYEAEIRKISNSRRDLYEFSRVCSDEIPGSELLKSVFKEQPELKELCKVNRMAVLEMTNLLTIPGPDRTRMDWDNANIAGGMTGGDADSDWSRVWGTHTALSVLPIKLTAMNALTTPYPYTMLGGWMFPIIRYAGSDGLFSYSTLFPIEFTEAVASGVEKNLKFNSFSGTSGTMGMPIMSMGYFLEQQSYGNDSTRMPKDFVENIRNQTSFRLSVKAIILSMKTREDKSRVTHFEAELYDPNTNRSQRIPEAFILPGGKLIVRAASRNFVSPITKIMFLSDDIAFAWAYHVEYDDKYDDILVAHSAKATLEKLNNTILDNCIRGNNDGLASYFNAQQTPAVYPGFFVMSGIANDAGKQLQFFESVRQNFTSYVEQNKITTGEGVIPERCEKAVTGVSMLVSTAAVLNGYFLPEVLDYLVK